jgi:hypothetical protein
MVSVEEGIQGKISKVKSSSYNSGQCGYIIAGNRGGRRLLTGVQRHFVFVHEDMQSLPLGGDVEYIFMLPFTP